MRCVPVCFGDGSEPDTEKKGVAAYEADKEADFLRCGL